MIEGEEYTEIVKSPIHVLYNKELYEAVYNRQDGWSWVNKGGW
jgi:hypothetical protein